MTNHKAVEFNSVLLDSSMNMNIFSFDKILPLIIVALDLKIDSAAVLLQKR